MKETQETIFDLVPEHWINIIDQYSLEIFAATLIVILMIQIIKDLKKNWPKIVLVIYRLVQVVSIALLAVSIQIEIYKVQATETEKQIQVIQQEYSEKKEAIVDNNFHLINTNSIRIDHIDSKISEQIKNMQKDIEALKARNPSITKKYGIHL